VGLCCSNSMIKRRMPGTFLLSCLDNDLGGRSELALDGRYFCHSCCTWMLAWIMQVYIDGVAGRLRA